MAQLGEVWGGKRDPRVAKGGAPKALGIESKSRAVQGNSFTPRKQSLGTGAVFAGAVSPSTGLSPALVSFHPWV